MKLLGAVAGLLIASACSGGSGDTDPDAVGAATDPRTAGPASVVERFHASYGHRGDHAKNPSIRRAIRRVAARLADLQADTIGDNAHNGLFDTDPGDGGWDFIISPSATQHSTAASPTNLFGAIGLAEWAAVDASVAGNRALVVALDAGTRLQRDPDIDSPPDFVFGVLLGDLAENPGFAAIARQHYDARRTAAGGATGLGVLIRDGRHARNEDGLIPYDLGWLIISAVALDAEFPGAGYGGDADTYAKLVVDDLTSASPRFNLADPAEGFYVTGVAWAQIAAAHRSARALLRQIRTRLIAEQHRDGAWGNNTAEPQDNLQTTAHALQTLALTDAAGADVQRAERRAIDWLLRGQAASGGWVDAANLELPLVDADIALGLLLARTDVGDDGLLVTNARSGAPLVDPGAAPASGSTVSHAAPQP